jgi:hypothetical protein
MDMEFFPDLWAMLSSDKSLAYWKRLYLPVPRKRYAEAMRFGRGCMEMYLAGRVKHEHEVPTLLESWEDYRAEDPVFTDSFLAAHQIAPRDSASVRKAFDDAKHELQFTEADQIYAWSLDCFTSEEDRLSTVAEQLYFMFTGKGAEGHDKLIPFPLDKNQAEPLRNFCVHINRRNSGLDEHFRIAHQVYSMTLPTPWEMLLQDYFYEGVRSGYWWMHSVRYSLQYLYFCERWDEARHKLGPAGIDLTIDWLDANQQNFPARYTINAPAPKDLERLRTL